jgi:hypothetical protein
MVGRGAGERPLPAPDRPPPPPCSAQVPLVMLTEHIKTRLKSDTWGNYMFWITFCMVGQPVSVLTYYHDWVVMHRK